MKKIDLTGKKFNKLTVISEHHIKSKDGACRWICECECTNTTIVIGNNMTRKKKPQISCYKCSIFNNPNKIKNLINKKFGRLTVIELDYMDKQGAHWKCICDCPKNTITTVCSGHLQSGHTKSCGCYNKEINRERMSGINNPNYNPDREQVKLNKKLTVVCGDLLRRVLKLTGKDKNDRTYKMLGYTQSELMDRLGIKTYSDIKGMEIDHIFPVVAFIRIGITDPKIINSLDNLQLLSTIDNNLKSDYHCPEAFQLYLQSKGVNPYPNYY